MTIVPIDIALLTLIAIIRHFSHIHSPLGPQKRQKTTYE